MATYIQKDVFVEVAGVDLSDHVKQTTVDDGVETQDNTAMGSNTRTSQSGLQVWSVTVEFHQDFAAGEVDATVAGLTNREASLEIRPLSDAVSITNPKWTAAIGILESYNPISGAVGDLASTTLSFSAGSALVRATS